jgi:hypothetical protein
MHQRIRIRRMEFGFLWLHVAMALASKICCTVQMMFVNALILQFADLM